MRRSRAAASAVAALCLVGAVAGCQGPGTPTSPSPVPESSPSGSPTTPTASTATPRASELLRLAVPELTFDQPVTPVSTVSMGGAIDPPRYTLGHPSTPVRVSDKGVQPSADAADTVYVGCHTSATHGPEQYPCDTLTRAVEPGFHLVATTDAGTLTYVVTKTRAIPYGDFASDTETWAIVPKRLVFVMCDVVDGKPTHKNYVIYATLA